MSSKTRYDLAPYADIEIPAYRETIELTESPDSAVGLVEIIAHLLMALIIFFAMWRSAVDVRNALIAAALYFGVTTTLRILARTHTLSAAWRYWLDYKLEHYRISVQADLADRHFDLMELDAQPRLIATDPVQPPYDDAPSYVSPYATGAVGEAIDWLRGLYGRDGHLDPRRVRSGYVQGSVIGSKRGSGSVEAKEVLIAARVIRPADGGYKFAVRRYPTLAQVDALARRLQGYGVGG